MTPAPERWRAIWRLGRALPALWIGGCAQAPAGHGAQAASNHAAADQRRPATLPMKVTGTGWHIPWRSPDPRHPKSPPERILTADADSGEVVHRSDGILLLRSVRVLLYHQGQPALALTAQRLAAAERDRTIDAYGAVQLSSVPAPAANRIEADRVTWNTSSSNVLAFGHVTLWHRSRNGHQIKQTGTKAIYNLKSSDVRIF